MILAQITFGSQGQALRDEKQDAAESFLCSLLKNGQIYREYNFAWFKGNLIAYVQVARPDSMEERYHSQPVQSDLATVVELFGQSPQWQLMDDDIPGKLPTWEESPWLFLYTHAFDDSSPVCCGNTGSPIPLYLLPVSDKAREQIYFWARSYYHHDHIWLISGALEIAAYKQLADPTSQLSVSGRQLCSVIEKAAQKPTYYYLMRYWGRAGSEAQRLCPLCGRPWHVLDDFEERPFHHFHFRCDPCRIVSRVADSYEDERHARIGEFRERKSPQ